MVVDNLNSVPIYIYFSIAKFDPSSRDSHLPCFLRVSPTISDAFVLTRTTNVYWCAVVSPPEPTTRAASAPCSLHVAATGDGSWSGEGV